MNICIFEGRAQISAFLCGPEIAFRKLKNHLGSGTYGTIGIKDSSNEPIESRRPPSHWAANSNKYNSPICFYITSAEDDDSSSKAVKKTSRGPYLDIKLYKFSSKYWI
jgi:hypothetical protein